MHRDELAPILADHRDELRAMGVRSLSLFGSVARGEEGPTSDIDLLAEFDRPMGMFGLQKVQQRLEEILGCPVDLGTSDSLRPRIRARVLEEAVRVA